MSWLCTKVESTVSKVRLSTLQIAQILLLILLTISKSKLLPQVAITVEVPKTAALDHCTPATQPTLMFKLNDECKIKQKHWGQKIKGWLYIHSMGVSPCLYLTRIRETLLFKAVVSLFFWGEERRGEEAITGNGCELNVGGKRKELFLSYSLDLKLSGVIGRNWQVMHSSLSAYLSLSHTQNIHMC